jgi:hypothetical protein
MIEKCVRVPIMRWKRKLQERKGKKIDRKTIIGHEIS